MDALWEVGVGVAILLAAGAIGGAVQAWRDVAMLRTAFEGFKERVTGWKAERDAEVEAGTGEVRALAEEMRRRDHDVSNRHQAALLGLEERVRELEQAVSATLKRRPK